MMQVLEFMARAAIYAAVALGGFFAGLTLDGLIFGETEAQRRLR